MGSEKKPTYVTGGRTMKPTRPAGPMRDRRTKRDRDRSTNERHAIDDATEEDE